MTPSRRSSQLWAAVLAAASVPLELADRIGLRFRLWRDARAQRRDAP